LGIKDVVKFAAVLMDKRIRHELTIVDNLRNFIICKDMGSNIDIVPELQR
jgi:hypothetical protein